MTCLTTCPRYCPASCHPSVLDTLPKVELTIGDRVKGLNNCIRKRHEDFKEFSNWMRESIHSSENKEDHGHIPYEDLPEFKFDTTERHVRTCSCGNIFKRTNTCAKCENKCNGVIYTWANYDPYHNGTTYSRICENELKECIGCVSPPSIVMFRMKDLIPITSDCFSDCSCDKTYENGSIYSPVVYYDPYAFNYECPREYN
jgi:hypothetical protein